MRGDRGLCRCEFVIGCLQSNDLTFECLSVVPQLSQHRVEVLGKMTKFDVGGGRAVAGNSWSTPGGVYNGSGGLAGTVGDYFRFATMLCNKGLGSTGARILGTRTVEFMALNHLTGEEEIDTGGRTSFTEFGQRMPGIDFGIGMM